MHRCLRLLVTAFLFGGLLGPVARAQPDASPTSAPNYDPVAAWSPSSQPQMANPYGSGTGRPGPNHWQNQVDYTIEARLDTAAQTIRGEVKLQYTNNSPSSLSSLWVYTGSTEPPPGARTVFETRRFSSRP